MPIIGEMSVAQKLKKRISCLIGDKIQALRKKNLPSVSTNRENLIEKHIRKLISYLSVELVKPDKESDSSWESICGQEDTRKTLWDIFHSVDESVANRDPTCGVNSKGSSSITGAVLEGPGGCGKLTMVKAAALEAGATLLQFSEEAFLSAGDGAEMARAAAELAALLSPSILLLRGLGYKERLFMLQKNLEEEPKSGRLDLESVAQLTAGLSGRQLRNLCQAATLYRIAEFVQNETKNNASNGNWDQSNESNKKSIRGVNMSDLRKAIGQIQKEMKSK